MALIVLAFLAVDMVISIPLVTTAIIEDDTVLDEDKYTAPNLNVS